MKERSAIDSSMTVSTPPDLVWSNWKTKKPYPREPTAYKASAHDIPVFRGAITQAPVWGAFEYKQAMQRETSYTKQAVEDLSALLEFDMTGACAIDSVDDDIEMDMFDTPAIVNFPTFPCPTHLCPNITVTGIECVECLERAAKLAQVCEQETLAEFDYFDQF
jgi:hypothetical protein